MDVIFPYVMWITLLAFLMDLGLRTAPQGVSLVFAGEGSMSAIVFDNVWKNYGDQIVLERINLEVEPRAFLALVGPSGCGKTTFLRMLLGEERPTRGEILLDGAPLAPEPNPDRGVVFQRYSVFPHLTVLAQRPLGREFERSALLGRLFGATRRAANEEARELLEDVGLPGTRTNTRRRSPAACSSASRGAGADAEAESAAARRAVRRARSRHPHRHPRAHAPPLERRQLTVVMVTHDLREAFRSAPA